MLSLFLNWKPSSKHVTKHILSFLKKFYGHKLLILTTMDFLEGWSMGGILFFDVLSPATPILPLRLSEWVMLLLRDDSGCRSEGLTSSDSCNAWFNPSTTSLIVGRSLEFLLRQLLANLATLLAATGEYWSLSFGSIIMLNFLPSAGNCLTQSRSFCSDCGRFLSTVLLPVRIS